MKKYLILSLVFISACVSTQRISWKTGVSEAIIKLPDDAQTVTVLDRVQIQYPYNNTDSKVLNPNVFDIQYGALNGFRSSIRSKAYLTLKTSIQKFTHVANGEFPSALNMSELTQLASGSDIVVSLEMLDQQIRDSYNLEIRRESLGNNTYREVDFYVGKRNITLKLGWRLYDCKTGEKLDEWVQEENYFYEAESREPSRTSGILDANYRTELTKLGNRHGTNYASRVSPTAQLIFKNIYDNGNDYLVKGAYMARGNNWDEAEKLWIRGVRIENKPKRLAMLLHNLAINEMRKGDQKQAEVYADRAAKLHPLGVNTQNEIGQ